MFTVSTVPGVDGKTISSTSDLLTPLKTSEDQVTDKPNMQERAATENGSLEKRLKTPVMTTDSVRPGQVFGGGDRRVRGDREEGTVINNKQRGEELSCVLIMEV